MSTTSQSIGSLVIDLRANVAQLQTDMDSVKDLVTKSSSQMSAQMRSDMQETRGVLALMASDFGITIPREIRSMVAASEEARIAVLAIGSAITGLAVINIGIDAFEKIEKSLDQAQEKALQEAQATRTIAEQAQKALDATRDRQVALELIGKGEDQRYAIQKQHFQEEMTQAQARLAAAHAEIAAKLAEINIEDLSRTQSTDPNQVVGDETERDQDEQDFRNGALKELMKLKAAFDQIAAAQKQFDDALKGSKQNEDNFFLNEQSNNENRIGNWQKVNDSILENEKDRIQKTYDEGKSSLDQELLDLRTNATKRYQIDEQALDQRLALAEQDPDRNIKLIDDLQTQKITRAHDYQKELTDIYAKGWQGNRKAIQQQEMGATANAFKDMGLGNKNSLLPSDLATSMMGGAPQLGGGSLSSFKQSIIDNFNSPLKDAAAQSKLLEQAMNDLLTPADKFEITAGEIAPLLDRFKDAPDTIKALDQMLLKANPDFQKLQQASAEFGKDLSTELDNLVTKGEGFHQFLLNLLTDLENIILKVTLLAPLEKFFAGGSSGTGGFVGAIKGLFGFADGGDPPVGVPSIVGENGPELFVPHSSGTVVPNGKLGGGTTNVFNIDARGSAPGAEVAIVRGINQAMAKNRQASIAGAIDYQKRR